MGYKTDIASQNYSAIKLTDWRIVIIGFDRGDPVKTWVRIVLAAWAEGGVAAGDPPFGPPIEVRLPEEDFVWPTGATVTDKPGYKMATAQMAYAALNALIAKARPRDPIYVLKNATPTM